MGNHFRECECDYNLRGLLASWVGIMEQLNSQLSPDRLLPGPAGQGEGVKISLETCYTTGLAWARMQIFQVV